MHLPRRLRLYVYMAQYVAHTGREFDEALVFSVLCLLPQKLQVARPIFNLLEDLT